MTNGETLLGRFCRKHWLAGCRGDSTAPEVTSVHRLPPWQGLLPPVLRTSCSTSEQPRACIGLSY